MSKTNLPTVTAIVVAAGASRRMGFDKLSYRLPNGRTVLETSCAALAAHPAVSQLVLVCGGNRAACEAIAAACPKPCTVVQGGATRADSVRSGLNAAMGELVAIHDAARPFVSEAVITAALTAAAETGAAAPAVPVKDTIKLTDENGKIRLSDLEAAIRPDTILVSIMHTNNEIGALEPIAEAGELIKRVNPNTLFHVDAVQGYGKAKILPKRMKIDMLSVSGHKIHGPKGIGFLYVGDRVKIRPIVFGGGQERGLRSGTENVPAIAGMGKAAEEMYQNLDTDLDRMYALKQRLADGISTMENVRINGLCGRDSAPHVLSVSFAGVRSEVLLHALEEREIYVSAGSACASNHPDTAGSATLRAIGLPKELLNSTIRFSLSVFTTEEEIDYTVQVLHELVPMLRRFTRR